MMRGRCRSIFAAIGLVLAIIGTSAALPAEPVVWNFDNLETIGGHAAKVIGKPRVIGDKPYQAIRFDGVGDAIFLDANPLAGLKQFTAEIVFRPAAGGPKEQRFFHLQENGSENRLLFETRLTDDGRWFLDTFIKSGDGDYTLFAKEFTHEIGPWFAAAIVMDGKTMRHFVNGKEEMRTDLKFTPQGAGQASVGVRFNKVHWYQGDIREARITPRPLAPADFLKP
ncbi:MAG: LamG-like jellyroll fold domain-containing protein [Pirellulaceae bacterium]|nr:LamG-like jellyroll fold domain-containing protein [Pirellulaceae bacterium]